MDFRDLLETRYYRNTVAEWLTAAGIFLGGTIVLLLVRRFLVGRLKRLTARTTTDIDDLGVELLSHTRAYFLAAIALYAALQALELRPVMEKARHLIFVVVVVLQAGVWGTRLVNFWIERYIRRSGRSGPTATTLGALGFFARFILWGLLLLLGLDNLGFEITTLVTGLGIGGIALALAVQNVLGDLFGALSIVLDKPFVVGDYIVIDAFEGTVEHVGLKSTRLRAPGGEQIVVSNTDLLKSRIRNYQSLVERRQLFVVGVDYGTTPAQAERIPQIIRDAVLAQPLTRLDRTHFARFTDSSLAFETVYFVQSADYATFMNTQQAINLALLRRFAEEGIRFAFPTRTVLVRGGNDAQVPAAAS